MTVVMEKRPAVARGLSLDQIYLANSTSQVDSLLQYKVSLASFKLP